MKIVIASGYFDPIHVGHIEYLDRAAALGDKLVVIVNNDKQAMLKKGYLFMPQEDRMGIVQALRCVDSVVLAMDMDGTVIETLSVIRNVAPDDELIFAKGGDRNLKNIPEKAVCKKLGIKIVCGLGEKVRSSSAIIKKAIGGQNGRSELI